MLRRASEAAQGRWPGASVSGLRPLPGGVSSLTFETHLSCPGQPDRAVVLKVAPPGIAPVLHRDVLRQSRLLARLEAVPGLAVPKIYFEDPGDPPLFAMELMPGECYEPRTDVVPDPAPPRVIARRAYAAVDMLARLQGVALADVGLADEPVESLCQKVQRWGRLLATVDPELAPGHEDVHQQLLDHLPRPLAPTLLHGDYRLGNLIFDGTRLTGVIDWEIWSVGDPRIDLAWLLMHTDPVHRFREQDAANRLSASGMPTAAALVRAYRTVRPVSLPDLDWFEAYSYYMVVATIAVLVKRNRRRAEPDPALSMAGASLPAVVVRALDVLATIVGRRP